jgi:hypothetical protein
VEPATETGEVDEAMSDGTGVRTATIETDIPARLERLPWSRSHRRGIVGLRAERERLERIAKPLTVEDRERGAPAEVAVAAG